MPFEGESSNKLFKHIETCYDALLKAGYTPKLAIDALIIFPAFQTKNSQALIGRLKETYQI